MALDVVFKHPAALRKYQRNPFFTLLEGYCQWLIDQRYARTAICGKIFHLRYLTKYLIRRGVTKPAGINWEHLQRFLDTWLPKFRGPRGGRGGQAKVIGFSVTSFSRYLTVRGIIPPRPTVMLPYQSLLEEHVRWLYEHRHLNARTVEKRVRYVGSLLDWLGANDTPPYKLAALTPHRLQDFLLQRGGSPGSAKAVEVACTLRVFLAFCFGRGYLDRNLSAAIPCFRRYKLSTVPRGIDDETAQRLLDSIDRQKPVGLRDYAIIQLLYTYGVRAEQVSTLRLEDIQWSAGRIRFPPIKCGKTVIDPLTGDAGDSLLAYLRHGRAASLHPEVFLIDRAPWTPITRALVPWIVCNRIRKAGLAVPVPGARAFRHRFATKMLAEGHRLKSIADMLGHRNIASASVYAKVDFPMLEQAALEWPGEES
jgi:site-specific recombinase XerD